jgi:hypothetical protein
MAKEMAFQVRQDDPEEKADSPGQDRQGDQVPPDLQGHRVCRPAHRRGRQASAVADRLAVPVRRRDLQCRALATSRRT